MRSLTGRLVATSVALVALVGLLVVGLTTFAMYTYLMGRLDSQVRGTYSRVVDGPPGSARVPHDEREEGNDEGDRFGQGQGTLRATQLSDGTWTGDVITEAANPVALSAADLAVCATIPRDGELHTVDLPDAGDYRVLATTTRAGVPLVTGLPTNEVTRTIANLLVSGLALTGLGVIGAALAGTALVRRQLRPLHEVAATAHEVSELPLATGDIDLSTRVPAHLTDERTEVGQVGSAVNRMIDHVESSLEARHSSEQQVRQFVADASHELRTPLATIAGYTELARRRPDDIEGVRTALTKVEAESDRMTSLVEDLLLLARLDAGRPLDRAPVDLSRLLIEAVSDARVLAPEHRWRLDLPEDAVEVTGDELRLHQVITNLLTNARRYTPAGTTVTITARPGLLQVHDDGPGFPPDLVGTAFERFARGDVARTRGSDSGVGLGLSLVRAIVVAHGGSVELTSVPGDTTVTARLPAHV